MPIYLAACDRHQHSLGDASFSSFNCNLKMNLISAILTIYPHYRWGGILGDIRRGRGKKGRDFLSMEIFGRVQSSFFMPSQARDKSCLCKPHNFENQSWMESDLFLLRSFPQCTKGWDIKLMPFRSTINRKKEATSSEQRTFFNLGKANLIHSQIVSELSVKNNH